jgi:hypothetical protein
VNSRDTYGGQTFWPIVWEIDYKKELEEIRSVLGDLQCEVRFKSSLANIETITSDLSMNPRFLHFCGHGFENNKKNFGQRASPGDGDFL